MYFDLEDHRPDTPILERPLTSLEQILLTIIAYLLIVIALIVTPRLPFYKAYQAAQKAKLEELRRQELERHIQDRTGRRVQQREPERCLRVLVQRQRRGRQ